MLRSHGLAMNYVQEILSRRVVQTPIPKILANRCTTLASAHVGVLVGQYKTLDVVIWPRHSDTHSHSPTRNIVWSS